MKCDCGHHRKEHLTQGGETLCCTAGCSCTEFRWHPPAQLRDDHGRHYPYKDAVSFVRDHASLFDPEDVRPRKCPEHFKERRHLETWCRAELGLRQVAEGITESWKGWRVGRKEIVDTFAPAV